MLRLRFDMLGLCEIPSPVARLESTFAAAMDAIVCGGGVTFAPLSSVADADGGTSRAEASDLDSLCTSTDRRGI